MKEIYRVVPPQGEKRFREQISTSGQTRVNTFSFPKEYTPHINTFSSGVCPEGCKKVKAYSKGRPVPEEKTKGLD